MGQTLGLAGTPAVLRTAIQTLLFQVSVLHSYRDVEFVTLVPEEDYQKDGILGVGCHTSKSAA